MTRNEKPKRSPSFHWPACSVEVPRRSTIAKASSYVVTPVSPSRDTTMWDCFWKPPCCDLPPSSRRGVCESVDAARSLSCTQCAQFVVDAARLRRGGGLRVAEGAPVAIEALGTQAEVDQLEARDSRAWRALGLQHAGRRRPLRAGDLEGRLHAVCVAGAAGAHDVVDDFDCEVQVARVPAQHKAHGEVLRPGPRGAIVFKDDLVAAHCRERNVAVFVRMPIPLAQIAVKRDRTVGHLCSVDGVVVGVAVELVAVCRKQSVSDRSVHGRGAGERRTGTAMVRSHAVGAARAIAARTVVVAAPRRRRGWGRDRRGSDRQEGQKNCGARDAHDRPVGCQRIARRQVGAPS